MELDSLWDFDDPVLSESRFAEWLADPDLALHQRAEGLTQLARSQGLQGRFEEGHATLDEAESLGSASGRVAVRVLLERGRLLRSGGRPSEALPLFARAAETARGAGESGLEIDALHMVALADDPGKSEGHHRHAIARAEASESPDARKWLGSLYNNLGWSLFETGRVEEALAVFLSAQAERDRQGEAGRLAIARWSVARALRELGRDREAIDIQEQLLEADRTGYVAEELAILYAASGDTRSRDRATTALEILGADPWFVENEPERTRRLRELAR